jgi:hypothetical protein
MLRHAASVGLRPADVLEMTPREVELWFEGAGDARRRDMRMMAMFVAPMINIHIAKGKKLTPADLLPRGLDKEDPVDPDAPPAFEFDMEAESFQDVKKQMRQARRARKDKTFWESPQGRKLRDGKAAKDGVTT